MGGVEKLDGYFPYSRSFLTFCFLRCIYVLKSIIPPVLVSTQLLFSCCFLSTLLFDFVGSPSVGQ